MAPDSQRELAVFFIGEQAAALPLESVAKIVPMAQLSQPPEMPSVVEGILNLGGTAVTVLRLDRLLRLPVRDAGLYSVLVVLKNAVKDPGYALLVERMSEILSVPSGTLLPLDEKDSLNGCAEASFRLNDRWVPVLSPDRILLEKERQALAEFQILAQQRLEEWGAVSR